MVVGLVHHGLRLPREWPGGKDAAGASFRRQPRRPRCYGAPLLPSRSPLPPSTPTVDSTPPFRCTLVARAALFMRATPHHEASQWLRGHCQVRCTTGKTLHVFCSDKPRALSCKRLTQCPA
ncbi:hypothetical protein H310_09618 [Aphanomyces invadans]|uniref:Uncharacterized protein n=1 Tax=Aphanomyces invadans TaxID=157072 RepID=A0A024TV70_9STRA|nr:hypothetical protein H310_09618 [Aphanomyces invadans]ETV97252.1 hypothetical protein H310_09618 [Aphanomyces invadans]|eukprot:XP_008873960.1 hypothetical protein H310_09618 [Aphanomyces invadans]